MSWASHNPEAYDEIVRKGIQRWLMREGDLHGFEYGEDIYCAMTEILMDLPEFKSLCLTHASEDIIYQEQQFFSKLIDAAKEQYDAAAESGKVQ